MTQMSLSTKNRLTDVENRLAAAKGEMEAEDRSGSLGLADANWYM